MFGSGLSKRVVERRQFVGRQRNNGQVVDVGKITTENVLTVDGHGQEGTGKGAGGRGNGKRESMHTSDGHGHLKGGCTCRFDGLNDPPVIGDQGVLEAENTVTRPVERPLVRTVQPHIKAHAIGDGSSHQFNLEITPSEGAATGGVDHPELNQVGRSLKLQLTHGIERCPRRTPVDAVLKDACPGVSAVDIDRRKPTPKVVCIGQDRR